MKRTTALFGLLALFAALLCAAEVNGKWTGEMQGGEGRKLTFDFKTDGGKLNGTVTGLIDKVLEIQDGKLDGDTVSFWVMSEWQGSPVKLVYKGTASANEIHFTMGTDDGGWSTEVVAKKAP